MVMPGDVPSRCVTPRPKPLAWVDYIDTGNPAVTAFRRWLVSVPRVVREQAEGDIVALRELAAAGELDANESTTFEPVHSLPDLFELKWRFRRAGKKLVHVRQYHAEPSELPTSLVALHIHVKGLNGSKSEIKRRQDAEMAHARLRFIAGERSLWGQSH